MFSLLYLTLLFSSVVVENSGTKHNVSSVTLEEDNLDDSITEIFNICKCVIFYLCDEDNFVIPPNEVRTTKVLTNNSLRNLKRIRCSNDYYYCCKNRNETYNPVQTASSTRVAKSTGSQQLVDKFPWMTAIFRKRQNKQKFKCGGSLIHSRVVLTQQQCVYASEPSNIYVVIGRETLNLNMKTLTVSKIIKHESYDIQNLNTYDIALVILQNPVTNVRPISLATSYETGGKCTTVAWKTSSSGRKKLQQHDTPVLDSQSCQRLLTNTSLGWNYQLHSSFLCVNVDAESCRDEGGGPLLCEKSGVFTQAGIVSKRTQCEGDGAPELYTNVAYLSSWIKNKLQGENIQLT